MDMRFEVPSLEGKSLPWFCWPHFLVLVHVFRLPVSAAAEVQQILAESRQFQQVVIRGKRTKL